MKRLLEACIGTQMTEQAVAWMDGGLEKYKNISWPHNWWCMSSNEHLETAAIFNLIFSMYPDERYYGFLEDDVVPRTYQWDRKIGEAVGDWGVVYCHDGEKLSDLRVTAVGGEVFRALGYICPPGFVHLFTDNVIHDIAEVCDLRIEMPEIVMDHQHFSRTGGPSYSRIFKGENYAAKDSERYQEWREKEFHMAVNAVKARMNGTGAV
jgi:hypothetical protein